MKKALLAIFLLLVPFSVSATTVYQQFSDSSGTVELGINGTILGSFTVSSETVTVPAEIQFVARNDNGGGLCTGNLFNFFIGTSTTDQMFSVPSGVVPCNGEENFLISTSTVALYSANYLPGETYYIYTTTNVTDIFITTNLSEDFYYGYLTADGFATSIPILPGLPGYTDFGISTTSQQAYCNANFGTSTGLLDSLGQSISLGFCNVGVFLFVPNPSALTNFNENWTNLTTQRFPFSWITHTRDILENYVATTTENFPTVTLDFGTTTEFLGFQDLEVISTTTISHYLNESTRTAIKTLLGVLFYLAAIGFIYRDLQSIWHKQQ